MVSYDYGYPKRLYDERVREAEQEHLAARVAKATRQCERRVLLRDVAAWLRALAPSSGALGTDGRHA